MRNLWHEINYVWKCFQLSILLLPPSVSYLYLPFFFFWKRFGFKHVWSLGFQRSIGRWHVFHYVQCTTDLVECHLPILVVGAQGSNHVCSETLSLCILLLKSISIEWEGWGVARVEWNWPKIWLYLANSTLSPSTLPSSSPIQMGH